ncbi:MAG TPA: imidazole glycerol phosphate synthase subunit HisH [Rubricoccaceae bacterium]|jgi:glutamine amidotransferase
MTVVVDYEMGNVASVLNMLRRVGVTDAVLSRRPEDVARADRIVLPGVGAFGRGMANLAAFGLVEPLRARVLGQGVPALGICLGMQLLASGSDEGAGGAEGLGWIPGRAVAIGATPERRVPHMGWNYVTAVRDNPLVPLDGARRRFYHVHGYHVVPDDASDVLATTPYGADLATVIGRGLVFGVQFHPEKSHRFGMDLLARFAAL